MMFSFGAIGIGILLLYFGAALLVSGSSGIASRFGVSQLVIGLTVVAYGTSTPELWVSLSAAIGGNSSLALGNVIGSNIFNIAVILGLTALIFPIRIAAKVIKVEVPLMIAVTVLCLFILRDQAIGRLEGMMLFAGAVLFTLASFIFSDSNSVEARDDLSVTPAGVTTRPFLLLVFQVASGLVLMAIGSQALVGGASSVAKAYGVSDAFIGLTIVAAGTSLPELATSVLAAFRRQTDIAIGNIVGSNLFNILCILGTTAAIKPISQVAISGTDQLFMLGTAVLLWPIIYSGRKIQRLEGMILVLVYASYLFLIWP